jgi:hypothetical protein
MILEGIATTINADGVVNGRAAASAAAAFSAESVMIGR